VDRISSHLASMGTKFASKCTCSLLIWILLSFIAVPFFLILFTVRFISSKLVPQVYSDISKLVTPLSSIFATQKEEQKTHVVFSFCLEGVIGLEGLRATFRSRVIEKKKVNGDFQWPELQQYIVHKLGFPFWKWDKAFNIRNHIHLLQIVPKESQACVSPRDVLEVIEDQVIRKPFPSAQSPWEILIVPNFLDTRKYGHEMEEVPVGTLLLLHYDHVMGNSLR